MVAAKIQDIAPAVKAGQNQGYRFISRPLTSTQVTKLGRDLCRKAVDDFDGLFEMGSFSAECRLTSTSQPTERVP
jgi:hypothetical protein